jgi:hypothetical protein
MSGETIPCAIVDSPFRVELVGLGSPVENQCYGQVGKGLMDTLWSEVHRLKLDHRGVNHWVYPSADELFTGVELNGDADDIGLLQRMAVELPRYVQYVHRGPYDGLGAAWGSVMDWIGQQGQSLQGPGLEIYGHWNEDPALLETTIVVGIAPAP